MDLPFSTSVTGLISSFSTTGLFGAAVMLLIRQRVAWRKQAADEEVGLRADYAGLIDRLNKRVADLEHENREDRGACEQRINAVRIEFEKRVDQLETAHRQERDFLRGELNGYRRQIIANSQAMVQQLPPHPASSHSHDAAERLGDILKSAFPPINDPIE